MGKLVRDKIPAIVKAEGRIREFNFLDESDYVKALISKVHEEVEEVANSYSYENLLEELADLQEVVDHLIIASDFTKAEVRKAQAKKRKAKGAFKRRYYMVDET